MKRFLAGCLSPFSSLLTPIDMNDVNQKVLVAGLERCLDDQITRITKRVVRAYSNNDLETATACLKQWETEGKLVIVNPLDQASDDDVVVQMKAYIEGKSPWPNGPTQSTI
jgi:hypothetical protein